MGILHLIGLLVLIGVVLWALNYMLAGYIEGWILALINKIAVVGVVFLIVFWILAMFGVVPPINLRWT